MELLKVWVLLITIDLILEVQYSKQKRVLIFLSQQHVSQSSPFDRRDDKNLGGECKLQ